MLSVQMNGREVATAACGAWPQIRLEEGRTPPLPWDLTVVRVRDGATMWTGKISALPAFYVQFGEGATVSESVVLGPAGPPCIPSGSDLAPAPPAEIQQAMQMLGANFAALPDDQVSLVKVTAGEAGQNILVRNTGWRQFDCEYLGLYSASTANDETPLPRASYLVQTLGKPNSERPIGVQVVDAVTGDLLASYDIRADNPLAVRCGTAVGY